MSASSTTTRTTFAADIDWFYANVAWDLAEIFCEGIADMVLLQYTASLERDYIELGVELAENNRLWGLMRDVIQRGEDELFRCKVMDVLYATEEYVRWCGPPLGPSYYMRCPDCCITGEVEAVRPDDDLECLGRWQPRMRLRSGRALRYNPY